MFSDTFAGIAPISAPAYVLAQLVGGALAIAVLRTLFPATIAETTVETAARDAAEVVLPHPAQRPQFGAPLTAPNDPGSVERQGRTLSAGDGQLLTVGSGGGIDVLLSARRVGPTGKA